MHGIYSQKFLSSFVFENLKSIYDVVIVRHTNENYLQSAVICIQQQT